MSKYDNTVQDFIGPFTPLDLKKQMRNDSINYTQLLYRYSKKENSPVMRIDRGKYISRNYYESVSRDLRKKVITQIKKQGFVIQNSNGNLTANLSSKENIRNIHYMARKRKLEEFDKFLQKRESKLTNFFANGDEIDIENIEPTLEVINGDCLENDLFRYATLLWSVPVSNGFGRRVRFVIFDKSNDKLIGIFALGDPVFNLSSRDNWIEWDTNQRKKRLYNVMDIFILGSVPPYNTLLGGKLVALIASSNKVRSIIKKRYNNQRTIIQRDIKDPRLALLTTGSALGKSSIYDRIKYDNRLVYQKIGYSEGWGHFHINNGLFDEMREYLAQVKPQKANNYNFGQGPNWKLRTVKECLVSLGLPGDLLRHGIKREIYGIPLAYNFKEYLRGDSNKISKIDMPLDGIIKHWKERWLVGRAKRKPEYIKFSNAQIAELIR